MPKPNEISLDTPLEWEFEEEDEQPNPIHQIVRFANELAQFKTYDFSHLVDPDTDHMTSDDVKRFIQDFVAIDEIYRKYSDALDFSLRIKLEQTRAPVIEGVSLVYKKFQEAAAQNKPVDDLHQLIEDIHLFKAIAYPNELREAAGEQILRYEKALGEDLFRKCDA